MSHRTCSKCAAHAPAAEFWQGNICKRCNNERMRIYRAANPDKMKALQRRCYEKNRDKRLAEAKAYAAKNPPDPERRRRRSSEWHAANRERVRAKKKIWQDSNVDLVRELSRRSASRRRAIKRGLPAEFYKLTDLIERDGTCCVLCSEELDLMAKWPHPRAATVEHLECLSWSNSPGDVLTNVAASHFGCNAKRGTRPHPAAAHKRAQLIKRE